MMATTKKKPLEAKTNLPPKPPASLTLVAKARPAWGNLEFDCCDMALPKQGGFSQLQSSGDRSLKTPIDLAKSDY
jgi:hypothetical protein